MDGAAPGGARPLRAVRIVVRVVLALALVTLLVLIGVKRAPEVLAAVAPGTPSADAVAAPDEQATEEPPTPAPTTEGPTEPATSAPPPVTAGGGGSGTSGGGGGSGGSGGGTTRTTAPAAPTAVITEMYADGDVACAPKAEDAPGATAAPSPDVTIHWRSTGGVGDAYFGVNTSDAQAAPYRTVHQSDSITLTFPCSTRQQRYTVTVLSQGGGKVSRSITVRNTGAVG